MNGEALGIIETIGMAAAIEAADSCVKSANVTLIGYELTRGSGLVTIKIEGNVGAVKAAINAAKVSAGKVNKVYSSLVIPRPAKDLDSIIESKETVGLEENGKEAKKEVTVSDEEKDHNHKSEDSDYEGEIGYKLQDVDSDEETEEEQNIETREKQVTETKDENSFETNSDKNTEEDSEQDIKDAEEEVKKNPEENSEKNIKENTEEDKEVCNICHDPKCPRRKGQPRNLCIHYKKAWEGDRE
ncbi:BMC domain-containing protein [Clostridium luticellarii]|uniref:Propanediol utilization protein PduA n=1 Tax=Clostridium luticellarii TaxID=1691940 RepID=A0A2T0BPD0_9CLOT|nr:BMC domain-containing protein [Clostridium luticellarii]PRR85734.1 Propanediol utilization protein PduA [Clostridium luticellarii]